MKEIREIFETVRTYCGMMFGDAKRPRGKEDKSVSEAARQLGSQAAKSVMGNTESILAPMAGEDAIVHERLVSVTSAGAGENQNEIIQSYPSPEFLNSLPFIKKFYPAPRCGEGKVTEVAFDNNPNSSETDHASMPLGIFASKNLAAWLPSCLAAKRAAFTLAEVLITLGIIGVVAALTLPTLIQNHQKQVYVTQLKKAYSTLGNAFNKMAADEGVVDWNQTYCGQLYDLIWNGNSLQSNEALNECFNNLTKQMNVIKKKEFGETVNNADWCGNVCQADNYYVFMTSDGVTINSCAYFDLLVDVNGVKSPNVEGRDIFSFLVDFSDNKIIPRGSYGDYWKNCSATNLSTGCTAKVLIEGKMNY